LEEKIKKLIAEYESKKDVLDAEAQGAREKLVQCELMILDLKAILKS
jgi:hypothetical protein